MRKYDTYKDSGIEWIGKIPGHWEVKRLKYVLSEKLKYGANEVAVDENADHPRYIRITDFDNRGTLRQDTFKSLPPDKASDYLLTEGDILFARSGATVGKTFQFKNYVGEACFAGYLIKATTNNEVLLADLLYAFTQSASYESWKESIFNQATIENIGADKYANLHVPLPPRGEQNLMISYLDRKTAEIDELIKSKRRLLELYEEEKTAIINQAVTRGINPDAPMKDSGIDWLGEVPAHWEVKRLKHVAKVATGRTPRIQSSVIDFFDNGEIDWFTPSDFSNSMALSESRRKVSSNAIDAMEVELFPERSIYLVSIGATLGRVAFCQTKASANQQINVVSFNETMCLASFGFYFISGNRDMILLESDYTTLPILNQTKTKSLWIAMPSVFEQQSIVHYIETESHRIDTQMARTQELIDLLTEYRTALISEVVTGKVRVV